MSASLRKEMQIVLDELQNEIDNELDKVSLERLCDLNPDLLANIRKAAEDSIYSRSTSCIKEGDGAGASGGVGEGRFSHTISLASTCFEEFRNDEILQKSKAWSKLDVKHTEHSNDNIRNLQAAINKGSFTEARYTQVDAVDMTHILAAAAAATSLLSQVLELRSNQHKQSRLSSQKHKPRISTHGTVDKSLFTNDGIKKKNLALIGLLYEVGLPFVSSSDGRRFQSQLELSNHLDRLFKRSQIEKSMARTEERGWYLVDRAWMGETSQEETEAASSFHPPDTATSTEGDADPESFTEIADESRDKCVVCGINFKMFFDTDDGTYKYRNCREIEVMNDDVAENESDMMLAHVSCWRGLGSPATLDIDQTLCE